MDENEIMGLITSESSWEQIIYRIVAMEEMNPWDLDLKALSCSFLQYISRMKELDFHIPAKYVVIAAVLLRMKSDHIEYLKSLTQPGAEDFGPIEDGQQMGPAGGINGNGLNLELATLGVPSKRQPVRKIVLSELIAALRNALRAEERRSERVIRRRGQILIDEENINERIAALYQKIDGLLAKLKEEEIEFSKLVKSWNRKEVLDTFIPLVHLDHDKKVRCRQDELFREIYIKKASGPSPARPEQKVKSGKEQDTKMK